MQIIIIVIVQKKWKSSWFLETSYFKLIISLLNLLSIYLRYVVYIFEIKKWDIL